jgi:hypothetical protein
MGESLLVSFPAGGGFTRLVEQRARRSRGSNRIVFCIEFSYQ